MDTSGPSEPAPDFTDVLEELEELKEIVDENAEIEQVRETMHTLRRAHRPRLLGSLKSRFALQDAGEAFVGSFVFGLPMIVEGGTLEIGEYLAQHPLNFVLTLVIGLALVLGILNSADFTDVEADLLLGFVPIRLLGIILIASLASAGLMTIWGRVDWADPGVALGQITITAIVMAIGAALGDIIPE